MDPLNINKIHIPKKDTSNDNEPSDWKKAKGVHNY